VATVGADGQPHVAPLWFLWHGGQIWLYSLVRSQRWADLERNPRISLVVDGGEGYAELHGVEIIGRGTVVGDVPRSTAPDSELATPELLYARKYRGTDDTTPDGRHGWLRVDVEKLVSWDVRKTSAPS
jgi:hypothetical protein